MKKISVVKRLSSVLLACTLAFPVFPGIASAAVVKKGNEITIYRSAVEDGSTEEIKWRQGKMRKASYIVTDATVGGKDIPLFIEESKKNEFLSRCSKDDDTVCHMKVNDRFQYGQDNKKQNMFLVFHNKSNRPYQHRFFTESSVRKLIAAAKSSIDGIDSTYTKLLGKLLGGTKSFIGDYLRDF